MRLAEHLHRPVGTLLAEMEDWEVELWQVWEATYGTLGQRRTDVLFASLAQAVLMPHTKKVPDIERLIPFQVRDWDEEATAEAAQKRSLNMLAQAARVEQVKQRFITLRNAKRLADWEKERGPDGEWLGPITDAPATPLVSQSPEQ